MNISSRHGIEIVDVVVEIRWILAHILIPEGNWWVKIIASELW